MSENNLKERELQHATPAEKDTYLSDGGGLYGRVLKAIPGVDRKIVFQYRFKIDGKTGYFHCGTYPQTTLKEARDSRNEARKLVLNGIHPAIHQQAERAKRAKAAQSERMEQTVTQLFETWERNYLAHHRKDGGTMVRQFIKSDVLAEIGEMRAKDVTKRHLVQLVIEPILKRKKRRKANAVLSLLKQMFRDGAARGTIDSDPTLGLTRAQAGGEETPRVRNLSKEEITELSRAISGSDLPERLQAAVWILLATGARTRELLHAQFSEFDLAENTWTIPAERSKNGKAHLIHLSAFAKVWIEKLSALKGGPLLFPGRTEGEPVSDKVLSRAVRDRQTKKKQEGRTAKTGSLLLSGGLWTPHDLRRTLASRMGDLNIPPHVIEKCLNHSLGGILAVYQHQEYLPERKVAFETWGEFLGSLVKVKLEPTDPVKKKVKSSREKSRHPAAPL